MSLAVTPDGGHVVVGGMSNHMGILDLREPAPSPVDPDALCLWAKVLACQRLREAGGTVNLSADEWLERWRMIRRQSANSERDAPVDAR